MTVDLLGPLHRLRRGGLVEILEVELKERNALRDIINNEADAGRAGEGRAGEAKDLLDKGRFADTGRANDGNGIIFHGSDGMRLCREERESG